MSMKANILRDARGHIIVHMEGDLNYDHSIPLREELEELAKSNPHSKITFDLGGMDFVGSSGICQFVQTIKDIKLSHKQSVLMSNVKPEFTKIFKLLSLDYTQYIADMIDFDHDGTSDLNQHSRKKTFEN